MDISVEMYLYLYPQINKYEMYLSAVAFKFTHEFNSILAQKLVCFYCPRLLYLCTYLLLCPSYVHRVFSRTSNYFVSVYFYLDSK